MDPLSAANCCEHTFQDYISGYCVVNIYCFDKLKTTCTTIRKDDRKIQTTEKKFSIVILNKTKTATIKYTSIRLELGMDEIENDIQKSRLR